jgi:hypothetical protein
VLHVLDLEAYLLPDAWKRPFVPCKDMIDDSLQIKILDMSALMFVNFT